MCLVSTFVLYTRACDGADLRCARTEKGHESVREEARALMREIQEKSVEYDPERKVGLFLASVPSPAGARNIDCVDAAQCDGWMKGYRARSAGDRPAHRHPASAVQFTMCCSALPSPSAASLPLPSVL
jgi:hypothetical protein